MQAQDVMTAEVVTVSPATTVQEIARTMIERRISAVPVVEASGKLVGIVSHATLLHALAAYRPAAAPAESDRALRQAVLDAIARIGIGHHMINVVIRGDSQGKGDDLTDGGSSSCRQGGSSGCWLTGRAIRAPHHRLPRMRSASSA